MNFAWSLGMTYPLRQHMPNAVYECTTRTIQGRYLLRPSMQLRRRMIGILSAAEELYPLVKLHSFAVLSNHWEFLASSVCAEEFSLYSGYVNSNFARECGRAHEWSGPFWGRRVRMIPCLDDEATIDRLRYCMAQSAKEGLVDSPLDWPGATAVPALVGDMTLIGERIDRKAMRRAREAACRQGIAIDTIHEADYTRETRLQLTPLPVFQNLEKETLRTRHVELLNSIVALAASERMGRPSLGVLAITRQDPHTAPLHFEPTPAPSCHTSSAQLRCAFQRLRNAFTIAYRNVADAIANLLSPRLQRRYGDHASSPTTDDSAHVKTPSSVAKATMTTSLVDLQQQVPPGMFLQPRFMRPPPRQLLAELATARFPDRLTVGWSNAA